MHGDLAAGHDQHQLGRDLDAKAAVKIGRDRLAQGQDARRRGIAVLAVAQRLDRRLDDMGRGFEIGLADAEVDDVAPLALQLRRLGENGEGVFLADAREGGDDVQHGTGSGRALCFGAARGVGQGAQVGPDAAPAGLALRALERGDVITLEEHRARNAARLAALGE